MSDRLHYVSMYLDTPSKSLESSWIPNVANGLGTVESEVSGNFLGYFFCTLHSMSALKKFA